MSINRLKRVEGVEEVESIKAPLPGEPAPR